ncbi:hypothetical protein Mmc1_1628 [Magnetococcus marinus MC-1]|uniref:Uncharacterized protein n=1 Tax=Magnetococcus marinus (strain ATCC BAA-1437 / JCM 17883 / MC-1) TaxID=156889 RepID=A0L844_MAGMM|nr:hypothetical protein [Magnetococcus marinus]ABK44137.1 hypothetical protein Mmc1_1628 [Magnetococcus marinus MC-1]
MFNPVQNVMVFGLLSAFQREVSRSRDRRDIRTENGKAEAEHHVETTQASNQSPALRQRSKPNVGHTASHEPVESVQRVVRHQEREDDEQASQQQSQQQRDQQVAQHALQMIRANQVAEDTAHYARWHLAPEARRQQLERATQFLVSAMRRNPIYTEPLPDEEESV